jgi:hypothetical protein
VDARSLRDISIIDAAFLYFIANAGEADSLWLAQLSESRGYVQIGKRAATLLDAIAHTTKASLIPSMIRDADEQIEYQVDRETQAIRSVLRLVPENRRDVVTPAVTAAAQRLKIFGEKQRERIRQLAGQSLVAVPAIRPDPEAVKIVVKRKRFGTLPLDDLPHDQWEGFPSGAWAAVPTIALYWCDGHRNLAEVIRLTRLELGPSQFDFVGYFRFLERHGYVEFAK